MNLNLQSRPGCAVDDALNLTIRSPRIEPLSYSHASESLEYQFSIYHGDRRYGLSVTCASSIDSSRQDDERVFNLDLGQEATLDRLFLLKEKLEESSSGLSFLRQLATGLLLVLAQDHVASDRVHYVVTADLSALSHRGIVIPQDALLDDSGRAVLAEYRAGMQTPGIQENSVATAPVGAAGTSTNVKGDSKS